MTTPDRGFGLSGAEEAFYELAGLALSEHSLHSLLQTVADLAKGVMPGDIEASVSLLVADRATTVVYTGQLALDLDESQYGRGYGPCLHAAGTGEPVEITDARTEPRWADYMQRAVQRGSLSSLSIPLGSPETMRAALNIYAREAAAFTEDNRPAARRFAHFAGVAGADMYAYQNAPQRAHNPEAALPAPAGIDTAQGSLSGRVQLS